MCDLHRDQVRGLFRDIFVRWIVSVRDLLVHHDPSVTLRADQCLHRMVQALKKEYKGKDEAYAAAKGMLKTLGDPFTRFLTPQVQNRLPL